jgi:predicted enzyme related to lactoylglutathione lyase
MRDIKNTTIYNWFQKVWNEGKAEAIPDFLSEHIIAHGATPTGATHGIEEFTKFYSDFRSQFKDIHVVVKDVICEENMESAICEVTATHIGSSLPVTFSGLCSIRKENGKTVEAWNQFDFMKMYQQIGLELKVKVSKDEPTYGHGKICYIELPSRDIEESASFYSKVFGWKTRTRSDGSLAFDDGVGQVSGSWGKDRMPSAEIGILTYVMIDDIEATIKVIEENGGKIIQPVGVDAPEITARFTDPAGNIFGLYQQP